MNKTKNKIRKNTWYDQQDVEAIRRIAEIKFGNAARWSQAVSYLVGRYLPSELQEIAAVENEKLRQNALALQIQSDRRRSRELGEVYQENLDGLVA